MPGTTLPDLTPGNSLGEQQHSAHHNETRTRLADLETRATSLEKELAVYRKTADQSVTNSIVLVNATDLSIPVVANEIWQVDAALHYTAHIDGDIKFMFTYPTGTTGRWGMVGHTLAGLVASLTSETFFGSTSIANAMAVGGAGTTAADSLVTLVSAVFVVGTTAGNINLQFAQNTANAAATTLLANSILKATKIA